MKSLWFRRIAIGLVVMLLLLVVVAATLIATFDANRYKQLASDWMKTAHQRTLTIDGPIELSLFPRLAVKVSKLRLSEHGRDDQFAAIDEAAFAVQLLPLLRRQLVIDRVSARGVQAAYLRDANGVRNIDDLVSGNAVKDIPDTRDVAPHGDAAVRFDISAVQFDDLRLHVRDEKAQLEGDLAVLSFSSGRLANRAKSPVSLSATAQLTRPQAMQLALDGRMTLDLDVDRPAAAIEGLDFHITLANPGLQPLELTLQGSAGADAKVATWKLTGSLNTNRFDTSGQAAFAGAVPDIKASARFDDLDLNRLLAPARSTPPTTTATEPADTPARFDGLKLVNGEFTLDARALAFRQYMVTDAKLTATLDNGNLRVTRLAGRAWGGSFEASGAVDASSHRVAVKLDASGVNVNALLKNVADKDLLEGTGHVVADLQSSGASVGALRSNLAGTAAIQLRDGAVKGINLARLFRQAQAVLSLKQDAVAKSSGTEKTDFSELRASARIAGGVAQSDDLDIKSPFLRIGGAGRFDIGRGRIDYVARATVIDSAQGQGGTGPDPLRNVTVPVALSGPFDAITWKVQWSSVAAAAVENKIKDTLAETLGARLGLPPAKAGSASSPGKAKDELRDRLKGLFK